MNRRERRAAGLPSKIKPTKSGVSTPAALHEAGFSYLRAGQYLDAQLCCQRALEIDPNHADSLNLMGLVTRQAGQYDHAVAWLTRAIQQQPKPEYLTNLGATLQQQGRHQEAFQVFGRVAQLKPNDAAPWRDIGNILVDLKRPDDALLGFQQALKLESRDWEAASKCGIVLFKMGRVQEAHGYFDLCNDIQPNHVQTLFMRGRSLLDLGRLEEALSDNQRAHALDPSRPEICNSIGVIFRSLGREDDALPWLDRALRLQPDNVEALNNRAVCLGQLQRFDESLATYARVRALDPGNAEIEWNLALLQMLTGDFASGWVGREKRWQRAGAPPYPAFSQPQWLGQESIDGKTIAICADEGLGDTLHFARYVPMLAARGARVILVVDPPAVDLLSGLPGVVQCLSKTAATLPAFDLHCPISSLPLAFGTRLDTIPSAISYLPPPPEARVQAWQDRLGPRDKLRVGLVWSGNPQHKNDRNRSMTLQMLSRVLDADATFVSLQKEPRAADKATLLERGDIVDLTAHLSDFSETAALVSCLDLVITVDTSVAHLAAALGRPTWILLPFTPDYRWLLDRDDSPWYPTARLFRQGKTGGYPPVLERMRNELQALIAAG